MIQTVSRAVRIIYIYIYIMYVYVYSIYSIAYSIHQYAFPPLFFHHALASQVRCGHEKHENLIIMPKA